MSNEKAVPLLTAAMAQDIYDSCEMCRQFEDMFALQAIATGRAVVVPAADAGRLPPSPDPEREKLEKDAARYRWLTEDHASPAERDAVRIVTAAIAIRGKGATDAAIDAAMQQPSTKD